MAELTNLKKAFMTDAQAMEALLSKVQLMDGMPTTEYIGYLTRALGHYGSMAF